MEEICARASRDGADIDGWFDAARHRYLGCLFGDRSVRGRACATAACEFASASASEGGAGTRVKYWCGLRTICSRTEVRCSHHSACGPLGEHADYGSCYHAVALCSCSVVWNHRETEFKSTMRSRGGGGPATKRPPQTAAGRQRCSSYRVRPQRRRLSSTVPSDDQPWSLVTIVGRELVVTESKQPRPKCVE